MSYRCKECGFHYETRDRAAECAAWCKEHKSCNLEITADALENRGGLTSADDEKYD